VFTETGLRPDILYSEIFPGNYTIYRHDRPSRRGGGVLIAVDSTIKSDEKRVEEFNTTKFVCVKLSMVVFCSYIPLASEFPECINHLFSLQAVSKSCPIESIF